MTHALYLLIIILSLGSVRILWVKKYLRRCTNRWLSLLLRLRSRSYVIVEPSAIVVIAPHQDDCTLGCGGLMTRKRLDGHPVHVVYLTDGSASHAGHPTMTPAALAVVREREGRAALRCVGVETPAMHFLGARDGTLSHLAPEEQSAFVAKLRQALVMLRPDEVFIPYRRDGSSEHEAAFRLFQRAVEGIEPQPRIFEYPVWSWWNPLRLFRPWLTARRVWRFRFRGYESIKISALAAHRSQFESTPPWTKPVMSAEFVRLFQRPCEFYFEI